MKKIVIIMSILIHINGFCQSQKPKLAVVLSGGGAKGVAHIPLLKALDSIGVKPDLIVGTSMGSVVGGLYAMGYSADTIEIISKNIDWDKMLSNEIPFNYINPSERDEFGKYAITVPIKNWNIEIPSGVIESQELNLYLARMATKVNYIEDFDQFPIAFRSVATDIVNGKKVVIGEGSVVTAIRASMAIPTVFTPVDYKGTILVDGGVTDNFPVQVAIDWGADIVIGSDVSGGFVKKDKSESLFDIIAQSAMLSSTSLNDQNRKKCDLLIDHVPNLTHSSADFNSAREIYEEGKIAVKEKMPELLEILKPFQHRPISQKFNNNPDTLVEIEELRFEGLKSHHQSLISGRFSPFLENSILLEELENDLRYGYGTRFFKKLTYRTKLENGIKTVEIRGEEQSPTYLQGAIHYNTERGSGIIFNITKRDILGKNARSLVTIDASENPKIRLQHQQYFKKPQWWYRIEYFWERINQSTYLNGYEDEEFKFRYQEVYFNINRDISNNTTFFGGLNYIRDSFIPQINPANRNISRDSATQNLDHYIISSYGLTGGMILNNLNQRYFSTQGSRLLAFGRYIHENKLDLNWYSNTIEDLDQKLGYTFHVNIDYLQNISLNKNLVLKPQLGIRTVFVERNDFYEYGISRFSFLGGEEIRTNNQFLPFPGLREGEIPFTQIFSTRFDLQWEFASNLYLIPSANMAVISNQNFENYIKNLADFNFNRNQEVLNAKYLYSFGLKAAMNSPIGPLQASVAKVNRKNALVFYFSLGFHFL